MVLAVSGRGFDWEIVCKMYSGLWSEVFEDRKS